MRKYSIIIPIYNAEKWLKECLDSVKKQTYNNFEVIMVDDGSKDESAKIACQYTNEDDRFVLYQQSNAGASAARNLALTKARGDYIVFIDSDDKVDEAYLEELETIPGEPDLISHCGCTDMRDGETVRKLG